MVSRAPSPKPVLDKRSILQAHPLFGKLGPRLIERLASYAHTKENPQRCDDFPARGSRRLPVRGLRRHHRICNRSAEGKDVVFNLIASRRRPRYF